jgi:excisionase family DNA binding protein
MTLRPISFEIFVPTLEDAESAQRLLHALEEKPETLQDITVTETVFAAMQYALREFSKGHSLFLVGLDEELSPQQVARLMNCSRTHVMRLLRMGAIPHRQAGSRHRIVAKDLLDHMGSLQQEA